MGDVVNLRRARKAKQRAEKDVSAEANRLAFGRTKTERRESAMLTSLTDRQFDGHRRTKPGDDA